MSDVQVMVQPTPNPQALKFIVNRILKSEGKATFSSAQEAADVLLARELFTIPGVSQLHFYENFVTVTFNEEFDPSQLESSVEAVLMTRIAVHDPHFQSAQNRPRQRVSVSPDVDRIEEILDRTIRPGLQSDGGDIEVLGYESGRLIVRYQGACGTCPSSAMGTLEAIRSILAHEFNPEIDVIIAPTE